MFCLSEFSTSLLYSVEQFGHSTIGLSAQTLRNMGKPTLGSFPSSEEITSPLAYVSQDSKYPTLVVHSWKNKACLAFYHFGKQHMAEQREGRSDVFTDMTELKSQFYHQYSAKDGKISRLLLVNIKEGIVLENAAISKHAECEHV